MQVRFEYEDAVEILRKLETPCPSCSDLEKRNAEQSQGRICSDCDGKRLKLTPAGGALISFLHRHWKGGK